jgi:predicted  nucleic acid-binding Zn-ribbon protein
MENPQVSTKKIIKVSRKKAAIFAVAVILIVWGFMMFNNKNYRYSDIVPMMESSDGVSLPSSSMMPDRYYPNYNDTSSTKDTREFMKVTYSAEIKTRDVKDVIGDVKNAIRDADGRMDNLKESPIYGYVNFVIPKSKFDSFKDEIENITHKKLITESISSRNLLNQKQSIEEQQKIATDSLVNLQQQQKDLTTKHTQAVSNIQKEITNTENQLTVIWTKISTTTDTNTLVTLRNQEYSLSQQIILLQQNLSSENKIFTNNNQNLKNQIDNINAQLENIAKQDTNFTDNVETVNGSISVQWVSWWKLAKIFSPIHPTLIIIVLILLAWYFLSRKNYLPSVEFV